MQLGLLNVSVWGDVLITLGLTHVTIVAVTIYLHRHQTHRALDLHFAVSHFFRFWLWLTTGTVTKEWVAIQRKHHARSESREDPHSPQIHGIGKVLFEGYELYRQEASNAVTLETFGHNTPDDWLERNLYAKYTRLGIGIMLGLDIVLLGPVGLTVWAVQMLWIPFFAAGVINGIGHYWGYRSFVPNDASRNIIPWGILIGGEELHNNHHAYVSSARLSNRWWELDIGWLYIRVLEVLHLATVRRVAPDLNLVKSAMNGCNEATLRAIFAHRYLVLGQFAKYLKRTVVNEIRKSGQLKAISPQFESIARKALTSWLQGTSTWLTLTERDAIEGAVGSSKVLQTIYSMRQDLSALWDRSSNTTAQLVSLLEEWCKRAETSGISGLPEFSLRLRCYH